MIEFNYDKDVDEYEVIADGRYLDVSLVKSSGRWVWYDSYSNEMFDTGELVEILNKLTELNSAQ